MSDEYERENRRSRRQRFYATLAPDVRFVTITSPRPRRGSVAVWKLHTFDCQAVSRSIGSASTSTMKLLSASGARELVADYYQPQLAGVVRGALSMCGRCAPQSKLEADETH